MKLDAFLTAYDPSDLPGGSIDPLGFETSYLFLAEKILPDLTNVASRPRYFGVLCAGAHLAEVDAAAPPRIQYHQRLTCIQRLERLWVVANVLASDTEDGEELDPSGIRGITYGRAQANNIASRGLQYTVADYKLLSRQTPYGLVGIYAAVAERLRMVERKTFRLTPDLGEILATAFIEETGMPLQVKKACREGARIQVDVLTEWGLTSHVSGPVGETEARCIGEAFHFNPVRSRLGQWLTRFPYANDDEAELSRLSRILLGMNGKDKDPDLHEAIRAIVTFEACYRRMLLAFERLLWLCRVLSAKSIVESDLDQDPVFTATREKLPSLVREFLAALDESATAEFQHDLTRLTDLRHFLETAAEACSSAKDLADTLLNRHRDVQAGKFDRGHRKMPWIERHNGRLALTMTPSTMRKGEPSDPEDIIPHFYRLDAADWLLWSAGEMA